LPCSTTTIRHLLFPWYGPTTRGGSFLRIAALLENGGVSGVKCLRGGMYYRSSEVLLGPASVPSRNSWQCVEVDAAQF